MKTENDNKLAFLDTAVLREPDGRLTTSAYRKPTHTDQYLTYDSHHPQSEKRGIARCLHERAKRLVTKPSVISEEKKYLSSVLVSNGYPFSYWRNLPGPENQTTVPNPSASSKLLRLRSAIETSHSPIPATSAVSEHAHNTGHKPRWNEVRFIDRDPYYYTRRVKEAIHTRLHPHNINRDSWKEISEAWMPTIKKHKNRRALRQRTAEGAYHWVKQQGSKCTNQSCWKTTNHRRASCFIRSRMTSQPHHLKKTSRMQSKRRDLHHTWLLRETNGKLGILLLFTTMNNHNLFNEIFFKCDAELSKMLFSFRITNLITGNLVLTTRLKT